MTTETLEHFQADESWRRSFRRKLLRWYRERQRDLPWRGTSDLYAIWVSEIMLQQTQVTTVIPYFDRFLQRFPTVVDLADADEAEVLRLWEGLGYYRRARQLHAAAQAVRDEHAGEFPSDFAAVLALPGVGRYTAGAILSIGRDQPAPIVEANTVRLYSRLTLLRDDPSKSAAQRKLWRFAEQILPPRRGAGQLNQAMMELGSMVCTPREPACERCPVESLCPTRRHGLQAEIPPPKKAVQYEDVAETAVVVERGGQVLLRRCADGERWAGLWDFLRFATPTAAGPQQPPRRRELTAGVRRLCGADIRDPRLLTVLKHGVTRYRITLHVYAAKLGSSAIDPPPGAELQWRDRSRLGELPLSVTGRRIGELVGG